MPRAGDSSTRIGPEQLVLLRAVLRTSRDRGFLGPGPVEDHVDRSLAFAVAWETVRSRPPRCMVDLGSGGGIPGLVLAALWTGTTVVLLDGSERRVGFLAEAVGTLGLQDRVVPLAQRAEEAGRSDLRGGHDLVVARSFGPPAVAAECGAPLLEIGGLLIVAEPPGGDAGRWPAESLRGIGLQSVAAVTEPAAVQVLEQIGRVPDRYPRRVGIPTKRPLWS